MKNNKLSKQFRYQTLLFLEAVEAKRLQRHLTSLFFIYSLDLNVGIPNYHDDLVHDLEFLFYFLDEMQEEQQDLGIDF